MLLEFVEEKRKRRGLLEFTRDFGGLEVSAFVWFRFRFRFNVRGSISVSVGVFKRLSLEFLYVVEMGELECLTQ